VKRSRRGAIARALLAVAGLGVIAYLVRDAGPRRVGQVLWEAGAWLPLVLALESCQITSDFLALRLILGPTWRTVPARTWVRSSALAYALMVMVPAGRAAGEVTRATVLSSTLGPGRATATSTQLQAAYQSANGLVSLVEAALVAGLFGVGSSLALLLVGNAAIQAVFAVVLLVALWDARLGRGLDRLRRRFVPGAVEHPPLDPSVRRRIPWRAMLACSAGRTAELLEYGIVLYAVGGALSARGAMVAHGIHLVGATMGDFVPSQLGVVDGAYRAFAGALGLGDTPARALSIAFIVRIAQLTLGATCVLTAALAGSAGSRASASPPSARADARS